MSDIVYTTHDTMTPEEFIDVLGASTLGERRPVDRAFQRRGIGVALIDHTRDALGPRCGLILLAAPAAADYYPHIGFTHHPGAWILRPGERRAS